MSDRADAPTQELAARAGRVGSAPFADGGGRVLAPTVAALAPGVVVAGPAVAVRCGPGDNLALQVAVARAAPGEVLVVEAGGPDAALAVWGEVLTVAAQVRGVAGLVLDGATRDVDAIVRRGFPLWCAARTPAGAAKRGPGAVGGSVTVGGVDVRTGEWVVADGDGVVVVEGDRFAELLASAEAKADRELGWFGALAAGRTTLELLDLDASSIDLW